MNSLSLIYKKRGGEALSDKEIEGFIQSLIQKNPPPDYQIASLLAFIFSKGMNAEETAALTQAMRFSGAQFQYKSFPTDAHFVDKHSTGGVGDKITLALMPLVLSCSENIFYPTIAGRGLGHTGGTVDKLQSIPGFNATMSLAHFYKILKKHRGCFLAQTKEIVPADRILYSLRNVTGTVESIPLMTASILSKKLAESLHFLLLDVKYGSGAFLQDMSQTENLCQSMLAVLHQVKVPSSIYITNMNTPLGHYSGNALEVKEVVSILKNEGPPTSTALTKIFAQRLLQSSGKTEMEAQQLIETALRSGAAYTCFERVITAQEGNLKKLNAKKEKTVSWKASRSGTLKMNVQKLGLALVELGAGRKTLRDKIDHEIGFYHPLETGDSVHKGDEILRIYYRDEKKLEACKALLKEALLIQEEPLAKTPLIYKVLKTDAR